MLSKQTNRTVFVFMLAAFGCVTALSQTHTREILLFKESFDNPLDTLKWKIEMAPLPDSKVSTMNGRLVLDTKGGVTVWLTKKLHGNIRIEFDRKVLVDSGKNDRLSDLNVFWMANDPKNTNLFTREGVLESYDSLTLYYVGMGGNTNSTTRFRKYLGNGEKPLLQEYKDKAHLLEPNKIYHISILVKDSLVSFSVNDQPFFTYKDSSVYKEGNFGFRSTKSRQEVTDFKVYQIE